MEAGSVTKDNCCINDIQWADLLWSISSHSHRHESYVCVLKLSFTWWAFVAL